MTSILLLHAAKMPSQDFFGRIEVIKHMVEIFVEERADIPETITFEMALVLARMSRNPHSSVRYSDLRGQGYYIGTNATYCTQRLIGEGYLKKGPGLDRRSISLELTDAGRDLGKDVAEQLEFVENNLGKLFSYEMFKESVGFLGETVHAEDAPLKRRA